MKNGEAICTYGYVARKGFVQKQYDRNNAIMRLFSLNPMVSNRLHLTILIADTFQNFDFHSHCRPKD